MDDPINQYLTQISQIEEALKNSTSQDEVKSLTSLKSDLHELLLLTKEANSLQKASSYEDDKFKDEMSLFLNEINELDNKPTESKISDNIAGKKCSAPHIHSWGSKTYHNALICEDNREINNKVKVLFTNPTHQEMIPCSFYLNGHCKFDDEKCRYSHGESISYDELKKYHEPDFTLLECQRCPVLVKLEDKLWHRGIITSVDFSVKRCKVKLQQKNQETECNFELVLPLEGDCDESQTSTDTDDISSEEEQFIQMRNAKLIDQSLLSTPSERLGQWEQYTKGVGSNLMMKMGYIIGTGLGKNGEGIINPVTAQILPPGRSLDHCMKLREQADGDKNLFSVEKKLQRLEEKQKIANQKAYEREKTKESSVFDFINNEIFTPSSLPSTSKPVNYKKNNLKDHTNKNLNVASFEISETIRKAEKEICLLNQSLNRHKPGSQIYSNIKTKLNAKQIELNSLKNSEKSISNEQTVRNNKNKLFIF